MTGDVYRYLRSGFSLDRCEHIYGDRSSLLLSLSDQLSLQLTLMVTSLAVANTIFGDQLRLQLTPFG